MRPRARTMSAAIVAAIGLLLARPRLERIVASFRTSSSPGAGSYDALSLLFLSGVYADIAADCRRALADRSDPRILEVGPGPGRLAKHLLTGVPSARWTGLDIDPAMLSAARHRLAAPELASRATFVEGDVAAMPFGDESFDLVVSSLSAHHWPDAGAGFREIARVLRVGGPALVYDLPSRWGRLETGSKGIAEMSDAFPSAVVTPFRRIGPFTVIGRAEARRL